MSMTGFGRTRADLSDRLAVSLVVRSVNHRYLDIQVRTNTREETPEIDAVARAGISEHFRRGRVTAQINLERKLSADVDVVVNTEAVQAVLDQLARVSSGQNPGGSVRIGDILSVPGLISVASPDTILDQGELDSLRSAVNEAASEGAAMRRDEAARLVQQIESELSELASFVDWFEPQMPGLRKRIFERTQERIDGLIGPEMNIDSERVVQEAAILADRTDVAEEVVRLRSHMENFSQRLESGGVVGRSLDFLCQEIHRELNTLGSKCREVGVVDRLVDAKTSASLISEPLTHLVQFLGSSGKGLLDQQVAQLRMMNDDIERLEIVDVRGQVVLRAEGDSVVLFGDGVEAPVINDRELLRAISGLEPTARQVTEPDGSDAYQVVAPVVKQWGEHVYSLVGTFTYANVDQQLRSSLWLSALILAIGLVLAHRVSVMLAGGITLDLDRLRAGVTRIQEGRLEERVSIDSRDEIEELANAFNLMADELVATIRQLREANRELETLDQTKADLVANVSHELKTPLTALRGYLELISDGGLGAVSEGAKDAVMVCRKNVQRLSLRVEELVQLSHIDRFTALDAAREEIDLRPILDGVIDTIRPRIEGRGVNFVLQVQPDLMTLEVNPEQ
ncbi:MAG: YicC family protein, partial [Acidobacteriota bacterium]